jgi:hypothetical protein
VSVGYAVEATDGTRVFGTLTFAPGEVRKPIPLPLFAGVLRVTLLEPQNAELTGAGQLFFQNTAPAPGRLAIGRFATGGAVYWSDPSFKLQRSSELPSANWTPLPGASPVPVDLFEPGEFFRLAK